MVCQIDECIAKFVDALPGRCDDPTYRYPAEALGERVNIDDDAAGLRRVRHRQRNDDRPLEIQQLLYEVKPLVEIGRVDHREDGIGRLRAFHATEDDVDRDLFFEGMSAKPVSARQVDEFYRLVVRLQRANVFLDRDARVIADALPQAGKAIKECAFAGIGTTDNRDAGGRSPAYGNVR